MRLNPRTRTGRRGANLLETAFVLPIMILILIAILDYSLFFLFRHLITDLARDGARLAAVSTKSGVDLPTQLLDRLRGLPRAGLLTNTQVEIYRTTSNGTRMTGASGIWTTAQFGQPIAVEVRANYIPILRSTIVNTTITAKCIATSEYD